MPFVGETVPLSAQMLDGDATKFVRATVTDPDGVAVVGSPFALVNLGGGKYSDDSFSMPNKDYIEVTYESFDDAGFTVPDDDHLLGTDVYRLEIPDSVIIAKLDLILAKLGGLALPGAAINAIIVQNQVNQVIDDVNQIKGLIERKDVTAILKADAQAAAEVSGNQITAEIEE